MTPIKTTPLQALTVAQDEVERVNTALTQLDTVQANAAQLNADLARAVTQLSTAQALVATLQARVRELEALVSPPVVVPPPLPPVTPPAALGALTIEGRQLRRAGMPAGEKVVMELCEVSYGSDEISFGPDKLCALVKSLGFNGLSPLFEGATPGSLANMKALGDAALKAGLIIGFNGDHMGSGARGWLTDPARVAYVNSLPNAFVRLEIEVDLPNGGDFPPDSAYVAGCLGLVNAYRAAGGTRVIQVGSYQGGRRLEYPLRAGAQVCAGDPLKKTLLGWQAYWENSWYQNCAGVPTGNAGVRKGIELYSKLPDAGCLGLLWRTNGGTLTNALQLVDDCRALKQSWMWWEFTKDAITDNNLMASWDLSKGLSENGKALQAKLLPSQKLYF